ncbi:MAG: PilZ domain-containing protein [Bacteriovoracaceae bacterium]
MAVLNLIKNNLENVEKRRLPRFPFSSLIFKSSDKNLAYEVKDISKTGMQVEVKDGEIPFITGDSINGELHWKSSNTVLKGEVQWVKGLRMGVAFEKDLSHFLTIDNILNNLKPLHNSHFELERPEDLKYWVMADGPVELFVWSQRDGDLGRYQIIIFDQYIEWSPHNKLCTGRVLTKRSLDTPLINEDEMVFGEDTDISTDVIKFAHELVAKIPESILKTGATEFILKTLKGEAK